MTVGPENSTSAPPRVSVIVPHYNDLGGLGICLDRLEAQTLSRDAFEIIVGDNNSPQGEAAVAAVIAGRARLVVVKERGAGPARNGAAAVARSGTLAFIDSDCQAEPAWLAEGLEALKRFDFVGGRVKVLVDDPTHLSGAESFERVFAFDFDSYINRKGFTGSGNLFCPRALFEAVGGFRTGVSEDVEWSRRAIAAGYRLGYAPLAVIGHPARRDWPELIAKWKRLNIEAFGLMSQQPGGRLRWLARSLAMPASAIIHTAKVMRSSELEGLDQRLSALVTLYRLRLWRMGDALRLLAARSA